MEVDIALMKMHKKFVMLPGKHMQEFIFTQQYF